KTLFFRPAQLEDKIILLPHARRGGEHASLEAVKVSMLFIFVEEMQGRHVQIVCLGVSPERRALESRAVDVVHAFSRGDGVVDHGGEIGLFGRSVGRQVGSMYATAQNP